MNLFELIYAFFKKNLKSVQELEGSYERKKQWLKIAFGIVLALGYDALHVSPDISTREII